MQKLTKKKFLSFNPCQEALEYIKTRASLSDAWNNCTKSQWMLWLLRKKEVTTAKKCAILAHSFANRVKHLQQHKQTAAYTAHAAAYAAGAATYAAHAADAAAAAGDAADAAAYAAHAAHAAACAAHAADAADAATYAAHAAERKAQCDIIRKYIPNPFD